MNCHVAESAGAPGTNQAPGGIAPAPTGEPAAGRVDAAALQSLVHHAGWVDHDLPLEQLHRVFSERRVDYLALVRDGLVTGLCSRLRLGMLLGARYGFALYSRSPAHLAQIERPLVFQSDTPVREVLDRALARPGDEFREDVALVDEQHALIGLVPIDALARLQTALVADQVAHMQRQHQALLVAHEALRQSRGLYAGLFDSQAIGVALLDATGEINTLNRRLSGLLNLRPSATGVGASLAAWLAPEDRPGFAAALTAQAHAAAAPMAREFTFQVPERGPRLLRCWFDWIPETRQVCGCFEDVTEQRAMERQLFRQEKQTLLDTLVGGIAHELNNKLTPVQGFAELIAMSGEPQTRTHAELIGRSVAEAAHIIRQLLQLSKPVAAPSQVTDLRTVVTEALTMLKFQVREHGCTVDLVQPSTPVWVRADAGQLKQVVINLALNALQATADRPAPRLDVAVVDEGRRAALVVADNGVGIPRENVERIFDPFFTTKGAERGTGLGLSVCFSIVRQHGGAIEVMSEPGAGARFTVTLPREAAGPAVPEPPAAPPLVLLPAALRDARVLVVDDEPHIRRLIQNVLSARFGCEVDTVAHGIEAFERLAVHEYALVISDIRMPAMNGPELYLWLREAQPQTAQRLVFVTGYPGENHLERDITDWNIPVLPKPFTAAALCELCAPFLAGVPEGAVQEPASA